MNRFLTYVPSIMADYPKLNEWLANTIVHLIDIGAIRPDMLNLNDKISKPSYKPEEDEETQVEDYFRLVAQILILKAKNLSPNNLKTFFDKDTKFGEHLAKMKSLILEDNMFDHIETELSEIPDESQETQTQKAKVVRAILE